MSAERGWCRWVTGCCCALVLAGCAQAPAREEGSLAAFGGESGLHRLAVRAAEHSADDPRIGHFFAEVDLVLLAENLAAQFCVELGGDCTYQGQSMRDAHFALDIDEADFNRFVEILIEAMEASGIPVAAQNRLLARLAPMRADVIHQ